MKTGLKIWLLSGVVLGTVASCNNINRDSDDVSTRAATLSADSLETMKLSEVGSLGRDEVVSSTDTVPANEGTSTTAMSTSAGEGDNTYTETEVVEIDTIATRIVYDIRRRTIEQVDTVGATKTYEIRKRVLKRTVMVDTLTETEDKEQTVAFEKGDYKVLDEKVETDSAVKIVDYQQEKREAAEARAKSTPATNSSSTSTASQKEPSSQPSASQPASSSTQTSPSDSTSNTSSKNVQPSSTGTAKQDTTRQRSESGS